MNMNMNMNMKERITMQRGKTILGAILSWQWTRRLLHWIIMSAGTMSELVFLIASIWMTVNASVHSLVTLVIPDALTVHISQLATAAYVALPECILGLAFVTTIGHYRVWAYNRKDIPALIWAILFGIPTLIFLVLSLITLGNSVANVAFTMPEPLIIIRAIAGYWYAFVSLLYTQLGMPQEADRLRMKDTMLAALRNEKDAMQQALQQEIARIQRELDTVYEENERLIGEKNDLYKAAIQSRETALQAYPQYVIDWLNSLNKTVALDDIAVQTGINKRRLQRAIAKGELRIRGTNKNLIWVPSLREYLEKNPPVARNEEPDTGPILRVISGD